VVAAAAIRRGADDVCEGVEYGASEKFGPRGGVEIVLDLFREVGVGGGFGR
jgi:hypothetical protein